MRPEYEVKIRSGEDFRNVPKAEISTYKWEEGYAPEAFAQLICLEGFGFCLHMEVKEENPKAVYTMYNQPVYLDSCLEFFVNFNPEQPKYMNFEMNSNGAFLAAIRTDRQNKTPIHEVLRDLPAVKAKKEKDRWYVNVFFSNRQIGELFGKFNFHAGDTFFGNFYKCGDETPIPHYGMWSPVEVDAPDFHRPEYFGTFRIEGGKNG